jgi:glycosyltransferase involved in cell wall biosynthesis
MRVGIWSPLPPSPSGIADYVAESLPALARHVELHAVSESPDGVDADLRTRFRVFAPATAPEADLEVYHLGNSPPHAWVYRAACARPGVAVLHDWSLHHLVLRETVERGDVSGYLREMRRAHGETGTFVGRQVARALGGDLLPALFPLNDRVLEGSLAVVGLTEHVRSRAARRLPGRPILHLPHHLSLALDPPPSREDARRALGLPPGALILTAPGLATAAKRLDVAVRATARLRAAHPGLRLVVAGGVDPALPIARWAREAGLGDGLVVTGRLSLEDFLRHLCASDVILSLRFPTHGEISGALVRALGLGRPALVTAGTPAAEEFPEGVVAPIDPGPREEEELVAVLARLLVDSALRQEMGRLARDHVRDHHGLEATGRTLAGFLEDVSRRKDALRAEILADRAAEGGLLGFMMEEVRWGARDLGLSRVPLGLEELLGPIARGSGRGEAPPSSKSERGIDSRASAPGAPSAPAQGASANSFRASEGRKS